MDTMSQTSRAFQDRIVFRLAFASLTLVFLSTIPDLASGQQSSASQEKVQTKLDVIAAAVDQQEQRLAAIKTTLHIFGLEPNIESVKAYLKSLKPNEDAVNETRKWIKLLEDSSYSQREKASKQLVRMPVIRMELLQQLLNHQDLEVAYRARMIKAAREKQLTRLKIAVLQFLIETPEANLTSDLLSVYDQFSEPREIRLANQAIEFSATSENRAELEACLADHRANDQLAVGCLNAIQRVNPQHAVKWVLEHHDELEQNRFKLRCAHVLAQNKRKESLGFYLDLLTADELRVRSMAFGALHGMVDQRLVVQRLGYKVTLKGAEQLAAVEKWRQYISDQGDAIEIKFEPRSPKLGRLLVCSYSGGKVSSFDAAGKLMWTATGSNTFTCQGLPNGNCLVMHYSLGTLVEYDEAGKEVKKITGLPKSSSGIQRLENGHTLLASGQSGNKIVEIDEAGKEVWSTVLVGTPTGARMQDSGLILVSLFAQSKLVEIDRKGKVVNEIPVKGKPYTAQRLKDGKILVAFASGGVAQYSEDGSEVWRAQTSSNTYWADMLEDGTVITADKTGILKFDQNGKLISRDSRFTNYTYISAY